jgi:8-oxo-dGTP pyrophosphatase MutT (NUDIX family)
MHGILFFQGSGDCIIFSINKGEMMSCEQGKRRLIKEIQQYIPINETEQKHKNHLLSFLQESENNFDRSNLAGHITGSAWLLNNDKSMVLLTHHRKLNRWLPLGGHADGETDILAVAIKEAQEESGLTKVIPVQKLIFDIDVHVIPTNATKGEPEHYHYDICYLLWTAQDAFVVSKESLDLKWVAIDEIVDFATSESLLRMAGKWRKMLNAEEKS